MRTFWVLSNNVERIQAQSDLRTLSLNLKTGMNATTDSVGQIYDALIAETGEIVKTTMTAKTAMKAVRDEEGFEKLRAMAR